MSDPVPAITEAAATGEIAAIFADIRDVLGVDVVNLIWRHLATLQGALPWAWGTLRPLYADGTIAAQATALLADLDFPAVPAFPPEVLVSAGLREDDLGAIRHVLAAYHRTNAMALIALSALLRRLDGPPGVAAEVSRSKAAVAREPAIPLPPLPTVTEMAPATAQLVLAFNRLGTRRDDPVLASMYRHLSYWPSYLALAWTLIAPLDADGRLGRSIAEALGKAGLRSAWIAGRLAGATAETEAIRAAIEPFAGDVIVKMVVICAVLRAAT